MRKGKKYLAMLLLVAALLGGPAVAVADGPTQVPLPTDASTNAYCGNNCIGAQ